MDYLLCFCLTCSTALTQDMDWTPAVSPISYGSYDSYNSYAAYLYVSPMSPMR